MTDIWQMLKQETKPILIYGTGNGADKLIDRLNELKVKISGVFASDGFVRERSFRSFKVLSFESAKNTFGDFVGLISFGTSRKETLDYIKELSKKTTLYMPEVPVVGTEVFDLKFAKSHKQELEEVYNALCDEKSKATFLNMINFKLSGEIDYLFKSESNEEKDFFEILSINKTDNFLDLGAYNGDTVLSYINRVKPTGKITAVEADKKTFKKLALNTEHLGVNCINAAVSNLLGEIDFNAKAGRGSTIAGTEKIDSVTIDYLAKTQEYNYIKFDVEGAELSAIWGAENTIKTQKPKMLISCYHKSSDYFTIPQKVLEFNPDYKVYMRHYPSVPAWDTVFYFV